MDPRDIDVRNATYKAFVQRGVAPTADEVARATSSSADGVRDAWRRLHDAHALVLEAGTLEPRMLNPFSVVPTAYRVNAGGRWWYANCAWDAFGVCAALRTDGVVETSCPDCGEPVRVEVRDEHPDAEALLFHCLVPAVHWWDDIVFT